MRVGKTEGGETTPPPMKVVSTATQLFLLPCVIECDTCFLLPQPLTETAKEKKSQEK